MFKKREVSISGGSVRAREEIREEMRSLALRWFSYFFVYEYSGFSHVAVVL